MGPTTSLRFNGYLERNRDRIEPALMVFQEMGGLSTHTVQEFSYRQCELIKVRMTFEPVGASEDKLTKYPQDKIKEISQPVVDWPVMD